jgi:hypothetical protein
MLARFLLACRVAGALLRAVGMAVANNHRSSSGLTY